MALLTTQQRGEARTAFIDDLGRNPGETIATLKADVLAAIEAADDWVEANAASFNAALPIAARTTLSARQKARILMHVIVKRYEAG